MSSSKYWFVLLVMSEGNVLELEVLVLKLGAIDGLATSSVASSEITTLGHAATMIKDQQPN